MNNRRSSFYPPNNGEYISPFTAPAMPNLRTQGTVLHRPVLAEAAFIPRSPLPPQKLAKLANALGISTPLPASSPPPTASKKSFSTPRTPSEELLSPESKTATPSSATGTSTPSRYLVHVIPPKHLPHRSRKDPEAFAAFRRGTLVPLHATLQAQISAIAREFQLPTTHGIVLYLVNEVEHGASSRSVLGNGPRISEDVWKWLWAKVAEEQPIMRGVGLGLTNGESSPASPERPMLLRKRSSPAKLDLERTSSANYPLTPSPSTPSTAKSVTMSSGTNQEAIEKEVSPGVPSSSSQNLSTLSNTTSQTPSLSLDPRLLPGLGSPSFLPVLAKVEFDIDRKIGTWYNVWRRSRRSIQKRKRKDVDRQGKLPLRITINDKTGAAVPSSDSSDSSDDEDGDYTRLSDDDELTTGVGPRRRDPLADVFGSDGEAWSELQSRRPNEGTKGDLALDGASLSNPLESDHPDRSGVSDEEMVALWNAHNQPQLQRNKVPAPLNLANSGGKLEIGIATATPSPYTSSSTEGGSRLPYLSEKRDDEETIREKRVGVIYDDLELDLGEIDIEEQRAMQLKIREKLDVLERNLVQFSPRALKTVDLSPDVLQPNGIYLRSAPPQQSSFSSPSSQPYPYHAGSHSMQLPSSGLDPSQTYQRQDGRAGSTIGPPVFKQPALVGTPSPEADSFKGPHRLKTGSDGNVTYDTPEQAAWPSVPYSILASRGAGDPLLSPTSSLRSLNSGNLANSAPRVILNGKANGVAKAGTEKRKNSSSISSMLSNFSVSRETSESRARVRQYEEEAGFYSEQPKLQPSLAQQAPEAGSPLLPLSPDPFGRFPSSVDNNVSSNMSNPPERDSSLRNGMPPAGPSTGRHSEAPSSRFSVDSVAEEQQSLKVNKGPSLVSMKSFRKLWRKNDKVSPSGMSMPASPDPSTLPSRPSSSALSFNYTETDVSRTPSPSVPFPSGSTRGSQKPHKSHRDSGLDPFYFDQDSKFTPRKTPSPSPQAPYQFPPNAASQVRMAAQSQAPTAEKKRSMRKSLVSKWKNGSEGSSSTDSSEPRRRRPSIADVASLIRSGGNSSISSTSALQSPSVPDLPAEYRMSQHSRIQSRGSVSTMLTSMTSMTSNTNAGDDRAYGRRKPQAQTSTDSSQESVDPLPTPVSVVPPLSFGKGGLNKGSMSGSVTLSLASPASGDASDGMRSSFDDSQFEILTPLPHVGRTSPSVSTAQNSIDREALR
ncbi:hypothetical protein ACEPAG_512 [Sanghuangporus baumii]